MKTEQTAKDQNLQRSNLCRFLSLWLGETGPCQFWILQRLDLCKKAGPSTYGMLTWNWLWIVCGPGVAWALRNCC